MKKTSLVSWYVVLRVAAAPVYTALAQNEDQCIFDGQTFVRGENLGNSFRIRCGEPDQWPCFCNPDLDNQAECPYCGFLASDERFYCAMNGENITFQDGSIARNCNCEIPNDPTEPAIRQCTTQSRAVGCNWLDLDGNPLFFQNGTSFGDLLDGACGPGSEWPSFCLVPIGSMGGNEFSFEYPYCVFSDTSSGQTLCASDGEVVTYLDRDGLEVNCTCSYSPSLGATPSCDTEPASPSNPPPSQAPMQSDQGSRTDTGSQQSSVKTISVSVIHLLLRAGVVSFVSDTLI